MPDLTARQRLTNHLAQLNLGDTHIAYDIDTFEREIREQVAREIEATSAARLDEIDELDRKPSDWDRHQQWCDAARIARNGKKES